MKIPILNIYHLLCYAWNKLEERDIVEVDADDSTDLANLFARVLISGLSHLLKRGFDRGYVVRHENTSRPRGKIDFAATIRSSSASLSTLNCSFDELSYDVLHNRILKTTLRELASAQELDLVQKQELLNLYRRLDAVGEIRITNNTFRLIQLSSNNRFYDFMMHVCRFIHEGLLVDTRSGRRKFRDFTRDETKMAYLFQSFVRNFYALRLRDRYKVTAKEMSWQEASGSPLDLAYLPNLRTDIILESRGDDRTLIVETKYSKNAFDRPYGVEKIRAGHLYQLFAYLENYGKATGKREVEGMLLYPTVEKDFLFQYSIMGHPIQIASINLNQHWTSVEADLLYLAA